MCFSAVPIWIFRKPLHYTDDPSQKLRAKKMGPYRNIAVQQKAVDAEKDTVHDTFCFKQC